MLKKALAFGTAMVIATACAASSGTAPSARPAAPTATAATRSAPSAAPTATLHSMSPSEMAAMTQTATPAPVAQATTPIAPAQSVPAATGPAATSVAAATSAPVNTVAPTVAPTTAPTPNAASAKVAVTLVDTAIRLSSPTVPGGNVTFSVTNAGTTIHEFVVLKTSIAQNALPPDPANPGAVMEPGFVAKTAVLDPKTSTTLTVALGPGAYVLICNEPAHYMGLGMHIAFNVQ